MKLKENNEIIKRYAKALLREDMLKMRNVKQIKPTNNKLFVYIGEGGDRYASDIIEEILNFVKTPNTLISIRRATPQDFPNNDEDATLYVVITKT